LSFPVKMLCAFFISPIHTACPAHLTLLDGGHNKQPQCVCQWRSIERKKKREITNYQLTPWSTVLFEKLIVTQIVKKFPVFCDFNCIWMNCSPHLKMTDCSCK
jgi:hypothetical protein